ncbi:short-chain dehydrogenase/reductase SDR [Achromobacter insolitus]
MHSRRSVDAGEALASDYLTGEVLSDGGLNLT